MVAIQATSRILTAIYGRWFGTLHLRLISRCYLNDEIASLEPSLRGAFTVPLLLLILFAPRQSYEGIPEVSNNEIASLPRAF
jgi:hypothetical protein